jgi:hypothetical protein
MNDFLVEEFVEVLLKNPDDFLKVRETLSRIGVSSSKERRLYQSCHILHKKSKYYIVHFKELFKLDGKPSSMDEEDVGRRNTIAKLLDDWGLVEVVDKLKISEPRVHIKKLKILPFKEKDQWELISKYNIGRK